LQTSFLFAEAQEPEDRTEALIELLAEKGIISDDEAQAFREKFVSEENEETSDDIEAVRSELERLEEKVDNRVNQLFQNHRLSERNQEELTSKLEDNVLQKLYKSSWAQRISVSGDFRFRYQGSYYDEENAYLLDPADTTSLQNTYEDRHRFRYRARLDAVAKIIDSREVNVGDVKVGLRLSSGSDDDPISTNDTLGDYQNKDGLLIDRAYLSYTWETMDTVWWGVIPQVSFNGGRIANPWFRTKGLIWDEDLNFEGVAFKFTSDIQDLSSWNTFLTIGGFSIQEEALSQKDKWLYGGQLGFKLRPTPNLTATIGFAYYDYVNIEGVVNESAETTVYDFTAPESQQKGNTLIDIDASSDILTALAADYNLANATLQVDYSRFYPVVLSLYGDYVENIGFDRDLVAERTGDDDVLEEVVGFQLGTKIGYQKIREAGDWSVSMYYRRLESDAVLDAYTDSDFHDGGSNAVGWTSDFNLGLYKDVWLAVTWITANEISGPQLWVDSLQVDVNARF
jgi:polyhydroxyalkanoate synthesis regulator phasin